MKIYYPKEVLRMIKDSAEKMHERKYYEVKPKSNVTVEVISYTNK